MTQYTYQKDAFPTFREGIVREWAITNGIGGYAGSSLIGAHNRTHQGYLIASLHPPIERYLVFSKINEKICTSDAVYHLETSQHFEGECHIDDVSGEAVFDGTTIYTEGQKYLDSFCYDGSIHYHYHTGDLLLTKHICLQRGKNLCAVAYEIENKGTDATLYLTPLFNFREHSANSTPETLNFKTTQDGNSFSLIPDANKDICIRFSVSEGTYEERKDVFDTNMQLQIEVDLETPGLDCHYCPTDIKIDIPAGCTKKISVICEVLTTSPDESGNFVSTLYAGSGKKASYQAPAKVAATTAFDILGECKDYVNHLYQQAGYVDDFANRLVLAADQFLCHRESTGLKTVLAGLPWFTDWGRDTMIAYTGLTLCTGRNEEAREILLTFSQYIHHGIVPNMFPDNNLAPLYNTVDASLWYFYAVYEYLQYNNTKEDFAFVEKEIYPHLKEIIEAYKNGTDFSIYMEDDGLIHAGSGLDQITWMDVRVGDWVATPRHGKPVEINALWYNALKVMEMLGEKYGEDTSVYRSLSEKTKKSFCEKFWNPTTGWLYDVVDGDEEDDHLRPNQIYAVSLPFTMLPAEQEKAVVSVVEKELFVGCGLRSLSRDHAEYHGIYCGLLPKRDAAYHQGTAWGFLLGGFISAYLKVHDHSAESIQTALTMLDAVKAHLTDNGCIGSISEIFDGDAPHNPRGCYAQAWSIGEVLRCYTQDILPYLK